VDACLANAIDHRQQVQDMEIEVGSVILTTGSEPYDPAHLENVYHYKSSPNVLTSLEFERILSASGPTMGHLQRPSDGKDPKKVAWLQCVGSRDTNQCGNSYCSSVCCMYAIKDSMIAKEHAAEDLDCVVFNMDIRTFGKDYEKYYNRAKDAGIRFIKSRIHSIDEIADTGNLSIRYMDDAGELQVEEFDMVVLSVGLQVPESTVQLAERLGIELNDSRFAVSHPFAPVETTRPGVYACGVFQEPKDIPSSVTEASAAACTAGASLGAARDSLTRSVEIPQQIDVSDQDARVGVFVCNCGVNISSVVDVKGVTEYAKTLPNVVYAQENLFTCSQDSQDEMKELIKEHKLNRVVVAACSPKTHEPIFQDTMESCGLNKYLFEMANIRNQDSWVHSETAETASGKAKDLVRMSVARAETLHPLQEKKIPVVPKGLVIGGGVAGMNAALGLADQGYEVVLIEKEAELGGLAKQLTATIEGANIGEYLKDLVSRVCCQTAVKNALHIKEEYPDAQVFVLYRDIRTYGLLEDYYTEARRQGVFFFRFDPEDPPVAETGKDGVEVTFTDHVLNRKLNVSTDLLVLSAGMEAEDTEELSSIVKLARTPEGYFMEAHVKLRPVDMATEGIFVCGTAHSPKLISESIAQAYAAASRAVTFLSQTQLTLSAVTAQVEAEKCASCLICVRSCPYDVPKINEDGVSEIDEALCHGCGICTAECPAKAIQLNWYEDDQIICKVDALLEGVL
jgi:heterodisulfide reductase subunit A-like polyferredoxin